MIDLPELEGTSANKLQQGLAHLRDAPLGWTTRLVINGAMALPRIARVIDHLQSMTADQLDEVLEDAAANSAEFIRGFKSDTTTTESD